jgi:hypothetical protein
MLLSLRYDTILIRFDGREFYFVTLATDNFRDWNMNLIKFQSVQNTATKTK